MSDTATAIAIFTVAPDKRDAVTEWQKRFDALAARQPGFVASHFTSGFDPQDDWAAALTFDSAATLHGWLAAPGRATMLQEGEAIGATTISTIELLPGKRPPAGVAVIVHEVAQDNQFAFMQVEERLQRAARPFPGYLSGLLLAPGASGGVWISVLRFTDDANLNRWLNSPERSTLLSDLRPTLEHDFEQVTRSTPFGSIVRVVDGQTRTTPNWKTAMLVFMVLFPTVMLLSRYLSPVLHDLGLNAGLSLWMSNIVSTILLTWVLMPFATRAFRFWLDPIDGAPLKPTLIGVAIVVAVCLVTLVVFMTVKNLQFWDFAD